MPNQSPEMKEAKISDIKAYEILQMPGCPVRLPTARSMTQAKMDLDHIKPLLKDWYNTTLKESQ